MASTSPAGASSNLRRSDETIPHPPTTATVGSSRPRTRGVTRSPVGSTLVSSRMTTGPLARRRPTFEAPPRGPAARSSRRPRSAGAPAARAPRWPRAPRPARPTARRRRSRSRSPPASCSPEPGERPGQVLRPVGGDQHDRGEPGRRVPRDATARWRSTRSGPVRRRRRRAPRSGSARSRCRGRRPSSRLPRSPPEVGPPRPVVRRPCPRSLVGGGAGPRPGCAVGSPGQDSPQRPWHGSSQSRASRRAPAGSARRTGRHGGAAARCVPAPGASRAGPFGQAWARPSTTDRDRPALPRLAAPAGLRRRAVDRSDAADRNGCVMEPSDQSRKTGPIAR